MLWALNPTNNVRLSPAPFLYTLALTLTQITEAIRRYGVSDNTSALFVVRIGGPGVSLVDIQDKMNAVVSGTLVPISILETVTDWSSIKKVRHGHDACREYSSAWCSIINYTMKQR